MGQYYKACILHQTTNNTGQPIIRPKSYASPYDIKTRYKGYDNKFHTTSCGTKLTEHSWLKNPFVQTIETLLLPNGPWHKQPLVWAGDYADGEKDTIHNWMDTEGNIQESDGSNLYDFCTEENHIKLKSKKLSKEFRYILNHSTKQFVDKTKCPSNNGWITHPLPILTCEGNGRGGGDYNEDGHSANYIGIWARNIISVDQSIPEGFTEIIPNFIDN